MQTDGYAVHAHDTYATLSVALGIAYRLGGLNGHDVILGNDSIDVLMTTQIATHFRVSINITRYRLQVDFSVDTVSQSLMPQLLRHRTVHTLHLQYV